MSILTQRRSTRATEEKAPELCMRSRACVCFCEGERETHPTWDRVVCQCRGLCLVSECSLTLAAPPLSCCWCCLRLWLDGRWKKGACCLEAANIWGICQWTSAQAERCLCGSQRDIPSHSGLSHLWICPYFLSFFFQLFSHFCFVLKSYWILGVYFFLACLYTSSLQDN